MNAAERDWAAQVRAAGCARTGAESAPWPKAPAAFIVEHEHRRGARGGACRWDGWDAPGAEVPESRSRLPGVDLPVDAYDQERVVDLFTVAS